MLPDDQFRPVEMPNRYHRHAFAVFRTSPRLFEALVPEFKDCRPQCLSILYLKLSHPIASSLRRIAKESHVYASISRVSKKCPRVQSSWSKAVFLNDRKYMNGLSTPFLVKSEEEYIPPRAVRMTSSNYRKYKDEPCHQPGRSNRRQSCGWPTILSNVRQVSLKNCSVCGNGI